MRNRAQRHRVVCGHVQRPADQWSNATGPGRSRAPSVGWLAYEHGGAMACRAGIRRRLMPRSPLVARRSSRRRHRARVHRRGCAPRTRGRSRWRRRGRSPAIPPATRAAFAQAASWPFPSWTALRSPCLIERGVASARDRAYRIGKDELVLDPSAAHAQGQRDRRLDQGRHQAAHPRLACARD